MNGTEGLSLSELCLLLSEKAKALSDAAKKFEAELDHSCTNGHGPSHKRKDCTLTEVRQIVKSK